MIVWTPQFPAREKIIGYMRLLLARYRFFDHYSIGKVENNFIGFKKIRGYRAQLRKFYNRYKGKRCFVIGNGPSLQKMDMTLLKNEITIGANGIYKMFPKWGFSTNFIIFEDVQQTELRRHDIPKIQGPIKLAALYNAYAFKACKDTLFMNVKGADSIYWNEEAPVFSKDFAHIVYLGSTITYIALQLAYFLGTDPVYLIGVDHDYGELPKLFPPGKIKITEDNIHMVQGLHFEKNYYKVGDQIGVPHVKYQEDAYAKAREEFEKSGRKILNAGKDSKLEIFEKCSFSDIL